MEARKSLTPEGNLVISVGLFGIHVDGYLGSGTRTEIAYAHATGKPVRYLEERIQ